MAESKIKEIGRIIYVEPNDVYDQGVDKPNGLQLTPKYEDFCISFNLIIEQFSRLKPRGNSASNINTDEGDNGSRKWVIEWGLNPSEVKAKRFSVLQGERPEYNYLTTYYTDVSFGNGSYQKDQVEGLGVESVQVSYESWYTPTVNIKFVDVRGSALFGREEAIHVDEKLTVDNVFGAFFTMPYPKFTLQIKGFLGKPVTYQLTCSSFKGEFNTSTGNFEANVQFIGYTWSLLTDIPFLYLVAAPNSPYVGYDYWRKNKNKKEWGLWDSDSTTVEPPKLVDMFKRIKNAAENNVNTPESVMTPEENTRLQSMNDELTMLKELLRDYSKLKKQLKNMVDNNFFLTYDERVEKEQLILFYDSDTLITNQNNTSNLSQIYSNLITSLKTYSGQYGNCGISSDKKPNNWNNLPTTLTFKKLLSITKDENGTITDISSNTAVWGGDLNADTLQNFVELNENKGTFTAVSVSKIFNCMNAEVKDNRVKEYVYLVDLGNVERLVHSRIEQLRDVERSLVRDINERINYNINDILGFKPYIGNVFKIIFCHLETFFHIMKECQNNINQQALDGLRSPQHLRIDFNNSDVMKGVTEKVTPWPAIYDSGKMGDDCGYVNDFSNVYGWVGDISNDFEEAKVVYGLQEGIQNIMTTFSPPAEFPTSNYLPILPSDFAYGGSPFSMLSINDISTLSAYLAIRAAAIFGVFLHNRQLEESMAELIGKMDACNLYSVNNSKTQLFKLLEKANIEMLLSIMYCGRDGDNYATVITEGKTPQKHHVFEKARRISNEFCEQERHPMLKSDVNNSMFVHWYDEDANGLVPSKLKDFNSFVNDFTYEATTDKFYFLPKIGKYSSKGYIDDIIYIQNTEKLKIESELFDKNYKNFENTTIFKIITDEKTIKKIENKCNQLESGRISVYDHEFNYDGLVNFVNEYCFVGRKKNTDALSNVKLNLSGNKSQLKLDKKNFINGSEGIETQNIKFPYTDWQKGDENIVTLNDDGIFLFNEEEISLEPLVIQELNVSYLNSECNIFGCPFYYLQNNKLFTDESDADLKNRSLRAKAILFLHTFHYNYLKGIDELFRFNRPTSANSVYKGMVLLLGGLLWRKRYCEEKKKENANTTIKDVFVYEDNRHKFVKAYNDSGHYTFFNKNDDTLKFTIELSNQNNAANSCYNFSVSDFIGKTFDINVENQLIDLFDRFVDKVFSNINSKYELYGVDGEDNNTIKAYNITKIESLIKELHDLTQNGSTTITIFEKWLENKKIHNISSYNMINDVDGNGFKMLFNEDIIDIQRTLKDLYVGYYVIQNMNYKGVRTNNSDGKILIKNEYLRSYLKGFISEIKGITGDVQAFNDDNDLNLTSEIRENRDLSISIYYYLKNLWDRWLIQASDDEYTVNNFFKKNFIFIDSFYKNIYHKLAINCNTLLQEWNGIAESASIFNFISHIVSDHHCIFMPVPDYVGFNGDNQKADIALMENLFRPMPYNEMPEPSNNNKFVVIYTQEYSKNASEDNGYPLDSFDIWSYNSYTGGPTEDAKKLFATTDETNLDRNDEIATRYGYNVPSFGVSFARQNNHIFKNLKVDMSNPVMTEQAIKTQAMIAQMGSGGGRKVCFIGQDIFNVFSNYSYSITIEMMGNAQICPLMYFQLLNVPMWRGTYMIYKVAHNMRPGDMTTTITAMKMSKIAKPFNESFLTPVQNSLLDFSINLNDTSADECYKGSGSGMVYGPLEELDYTNVERLSSSNIFVKQNPRWTDDEYDRWKMTMCGITKTVPSEIEDEEDLIVADKTMTPEEAMERGLIAWVKFNQTGKPKRLKMNINIADDFAKICDEILAKVPEFKLNVGNCYREVNSVKNGMSKHCWGIAVDINPGFEGNPWFDRRINREDPEPQPGTRPWPMREESKYYGVYDPTKCIWHYGHPVVKIFEEHGWVWGGSFGDVMHFSLVTG